MPNIETIKGILKAAEVKAAFDRNYKLAADLKTVFDSVPDLLLESGKKVPSSPQLSLGFFQGVGRHKNKLAFRGESRNARGHYTHQMPFGAVLEMWGALVNAVPLSNGKRVKVLATSMSLKNMLETFTPNEPDYQYGLMARWATYNNWDCSTPLSTLNEAFNRLPQMSK